MSAVRTLFFAKRVPGQPAPYDTLQVSVLYPAKTGTSEQERQHGVVAADPSGAPYPVVVFLTGVGCEPLRYQWLLLALARGGCVCACASWVAETLPGVVSLTPGMDLDFAQPGTYGTGPTASAVAPVLESLAEAHAGDGPLAGVLDLDRVVLGGHSGGGVVALHSARPEYFPGVKGVFTYASHTVPSASLGFETAAPLAITSELPVLLLAGNQDGLIVSTSPGLDPEVPVRRTFEQALDGERGDRHLVVLDGANHFTCVFPADPTASRAFLDRAPSADEGKLRALMARLVGVFVDAHVRCIDGATDALRSLFDDPLIASHASR